MITRVIRGNGGRTVPGLPIDSLGLWEQHKADLVLGARSPLTIRARRQVLVMLGVDIGTATAADIRRFLAQSTPGGRPRSATTRKAYRAHLSSFYAWCVFNDILDRSPMAKIPTIKVKPGVPRPILPPDLERALASARPSVRAWLLLGALEGLRCCEIARLRAEDVSPEGIIVLGKGERSRVMPIHPLVAEVFEALPAEGYLFPSKAGHVGAQHVSTSVNEHLRSLGIKSTAHKTRHRFGTDAYAVDRDILATSQLLGHASVAQTQVYAQVNQSALARIVAALKIGA